MLQQQKNNTKVQFKKTFKPLQKNISGFHHHKDIFDKGAN